MFSGFDKIAQGLVKNAISSLEADAKHYERKARDARDLAAVLKKMTPEIMKVLKPPKPFKPLTKAQMKRMGLIPPSGPFVGPGVAVARAK